MMIQHDKRQAYVGALHRTAEMKCLNLKSIKKHLAFNPILVKKTGEGADGWLSRVSLEQTFAAITHGMYFYLLSPC